MQRDRLFVQPNHRLGGTIGLLIHCQNVFHLAELLSVEIGDAPYFPPPRLQVVATQQNPDGLASHARNRFSLHGFLGDQPHRTARLSFGGLTAHHCDHALLFGGIQRLRRTTSLPLVQRPFESCFLISMGDAPTCLGRKVNDTSHHRCGLARRQLLQGNGPEHHPNPLNPGPKNLADCFLIFPRHLKLDGGLDVPQYKPQHSE
jgi:hypothetical protein